MNLYPLNHKEGNCNASCSVFAKAMKKKPLPQPNVRINLDHIDRINVEDGAYIVYIGGVTYRVHDRKAFDAALLATAAPQDVRVVAPIPPE